MSVRCTVIDARTLVPFDDETVLASLRETSRLVVVAEGPATGSWGSALIARVAQHGFELLDDIVAEVRSAVAY